MKVVVIEPTLYPWSRWLYGHLGQLCNLTLLVGQPDERFLKVTQEENVRVSYLRSLRIPKFKRHPAGYIEEFKVQIPFDLLSKLHAIRPDVIFSKELGFRTLFCWFYCRVTGTPLVIGTNMTQRTEQGRGGLRMLLRRFLLGHELLVTYNGNDCLRYLTEIGAQASSLRYLPYVAGRDCIWEGAPKRSPDSARRMLCIGRIIPRKGQCRFVELLSNWCQLNPKQEVQLTLVGSGSDSDKLKSLKVSPNLQLNIQEHCTQVELKHHFGAHGILAFPTLADEWGIVVNEALASGLPVLGSVYSQAVDDLVRPGANGWHFNPDDPESLNRVLSSVFSLSESELDQCRVEAQESVAHLVPAYAANLLFATLKEALENELRP